jgi:hypothetical protein
MAKICIAGKELLRHAHGNHESHNLTVGFSGAVRDGIP